MYFKALPWFEEAVKTPQNFNGKKVSVVINNQPEFGFFSTLQTVLQKIKIEVSIIVLPIDVPFLNKNALEEVIAIDNEVVIPNYKSKNGHPVKLSYRFWKPFLKIVNTSKEARLDLQIKKKNASQISVVEINDASVLKNLNTPKKWQEFKNS